MEIPGKSVFYAADKVLSNFRNVFVFRVAEENVRVERVKEGTIIISKGSRMIAQIPKKGQETQSLSRWMDIH